MRSSRNVVVARHLRCLLKPDETPEEAMLKLALKVLEWALGHTEASAEELLHDDFVFCSEIFRYGKIDFISSVKVRAPFSAIKILSTFARESEAAIFFEGVDPVTALFHRRAWLVERRDGQIGKVTSLNTVVNVK